MVASLTTFATATEDVSQATRAGPSGALKGTGRRVSCTTRVSPVKWTINERYGLGRDESQFIVYRAVKHKSTKHKSREHKPVAFFASLEAALLWIVMRQAHFDDEPTIDTDILDAFQRYCHALDRVKADITALAERLEAAIERQRS